MRILVTRTDRLGDVLLATPVLKRIVDFFPEAQVSFLVQKMWMPILQFESKVQLIEYRPGESAVQLGARLKKEKFDSVIVLRDEKKVSQAIFRAGIPLRVGPYSSFRSFLFFNRGKYQRRSQCKMHEAEYNMSLLTRIGISFEGVAVRAEELPRSWIAFGDEAGVRVGEWLGSKGLEAKPFVCLHPGSSGSARYLSQESLSALIQALFKAGHPVVLTGGAQEKEILQKFKVAIPEVVLFDLTGLDELAALYRRAGVVIAHGTGPLHLAAAVETPVFAVFPPLFVLSEKRWGPLTSRRLVWVPPLVNCPEKYRCRGPKCAYYDCMGRFDAQTAIQQIENLIQSR